MTGYENSPDYGGPMPTWRRILVALAIAAVVVALILAFGPRAQEMVGSVGRVIDGDTFWLCNDTECRKFRLCGIDAPERAEARAHESTEALAGLVKGMEVRCRTVGAGTPCDGRSKPTNGDRIVAQCFLGAGSLDLADAMVSQGFACDWPKFSGGAYSVLGEACTRGYPWHRPN